jgi:predicted transcriptional regulator
MRTLTITLQADWKSALRAAGARAESGVADGRYQGETLNFETPAQFFGRLTERRWAIVRLMQGAGALGVRELARRVGRDVKRVHEDVQVLLELGLIEKTDQGEIVCPYRDIHVDMHLRAAA